MEAFNSQEFIEYLNEFRYVGGQDGDDPADDEQTPEEGEEEVEWLRQAGFDYLVSALEQQSADIPDEDWEALHTLNHRQAAVVKRRVQTLRDTLRRRKNRDKARKPDIRHLFPGGSAGGESASSGTRSRSATPDSLDSLSPPHTPPDVFSRLEASSPHSQGYHSSSRGSLDQLEQQPPDTEDRDRLSDYRHVLRIALDQTSGSRDQNQEDSVRFRRKPRDTPDRGHKSISLFESTGNYNVARLSSPTSTDSKGIEIVSFNQIGSVRRPSDHRPASAFSALSQGSELHIPRVRSGSRADIYAGSPKETEKQASVDNTLLTRRCSAEERRLGRTRLDQLSDPDVKRVQKLALLELTGLLDEHNITYSRRKVRRRRLRARPSGADGAVFGTPLNQLLDRDRQRLGEARSVPVVLEKILSHLERHGIGEEGLLRVPGHSQKIELLKQEIDDKFYSQPGAVDAALRRSSPNDAAALVKHFLRELPSPLLTNELMDAFYKSDALPSGETQLQALALLCLQLPPANRAVLRCLLSFLAEIAANESKNKMSLENVAMIMAPNLILPYSPRRQKDINVEITFASVTSRVVRRLIQFRQQLWVVPPEFIRQIRDQYEEELYGKAKKESNRPMKILMRKRDTAIMRKIENEVDFQLGVIRVYAPQFSKSNWPVQLTADTTAGEVVTRCIQGSLLLPELASRVQGRREQRRKHFEELSPDGSTGCQQAAATDLATATRTHALCEVGGNIGERRLDPSASMMECYKENPNARWVVKCCHRNGKRSSVEIVA